ncbi:MAG: hypothetical protein ACO1NZ_15390 [Adhaeribacter sp.]
MKNLLLSLLCCLVTWFPGRAQQPGGTFTNLGPQLQAAMIQGSLFVRDPAGRELVYTVVRGEPAHLLGYEVESGRQILDFVLPNSDGAWDMAQASDGSLYVPGASGFLFRHQPGSQQVDNLGRALEGQTYVWSLTAGKDGEIFGATYPGCRVFRYHPAEGFSDVGRGPLVAGENYVRSLAYHPKTDLLYAGVGSHAHLLELNPRSGRKRELLAEKYRHKEFVYSLELAREVKGGDRLLALLTSGDTTVVYNLKTKRFEQEIAEMDMKAVLQAPSGSTLYYTAGGQLRSRDLRKPDRPHRVLASVPGSANAMAWGKNKDLLVLGSQGALLRYELKTGRLHSRQLAIPPQPIPLNALLLGPDQRLWMGGYLAGGHAALDTRSDLTTPYPGLDQTEGMAVRGSQIYYGIYPGGRFYVHDTRQAWDPKAGNPRLLGQIPGQSRSFALLHLPDHDKLYFGTVPEYGQLGGTLVEYDPKTDQMKTFEAVVPRQSLVSLAYAGGTLWGGSTITGGLGIKPAEKEAHLFGWDPVSNTRTFDLVPVPGAIAITCLVNGPGGKLWGVADGTLFVFDPISRQVLSRHQLFEVPANRSHVWRDVFLSLHPSGQVYGTGQSQFFRIDPKTMQVTILQKSAALLAQDTQGRLYFRRGINLWRYEP